MHLAPTTSRAAAPSRASAGHEVAWTAGALRPCPFCGARAALETDPWQDGSVRIACGSPECPVRPRTEFLLLRFADELRAAWNDRPGDRSGA